MPDTAPVVVDYQSPGHYRPRRTRSLGEELFKLACLATIFVAYGLEGDREKPVDAFFVAGLLIWLVIAAVGATAWIRPLQFRSRISAAWAGPVITLLLVTLAWFPFSLRDYYACPHGERWANNQIGIARSVTGGPCGNGPRPRARGSTWHVTGPWYLFIPTTPY